MFYEIYRHEHEGELPCIWHKTLVSYPDLGVWHLTAGSLYFVKDAHAFEIANEIELLLI